MGSPLSMPLGKRCQRYRVLPIVDFYRNTLVQDACLEIPSDTTIVIASGVTLGIIATNGLRIGKNVRFSATGGEGARGERADFGTVTFTPESDERINALCVDNGNRCACPVASSDAVAVLGHGGAPGTPGGTLRLVVGDLVSTGQLKGLSIDVAGGRGGPPGESGRLSCTRGPVQCSSNPCTEGTRNGSAGPAGQVVFALAGSKHSEMLHLLSAACNPSGTASLIPIASSEAMQSEISALNEMAFQNVWDRRSGYDPE